MTFPALLVNRFSILHKDTWNLTCTVPDNKWLKLTYRPSVPIFCRLLLCWPLWRMAEQDLEMTTEDEATKQVFQIFQNMTPLWTDMSLKLEERPGPDKRPRRGEPPEQSPKPKGNQPQPQLAKAMGLMAKLVVQLDKDMQIMKAEDTCIFFFNNNEPSGCLPLMLKATETWYAATSKLMPLRQKLMQVLLNELQTRVQTLGNAQQGSELFQTALKNNIVLQDKSFPYLEWDHTKQSLQISKRPSISLKRMHQICSDLLELLTDVEVVRRFHALPTKSKSSITPWKLQICLRNTAPWQLLLELSQSSAWMLIGTSMKRHSMFQSSLASQLQQTLGLHPQKSKGQSKGKPSGRKLPAPKEES